MALRSPGGRVRQLLLWLGGAALAACGSARIGDAAPGSADPGGSGRPVAPTITAGPQPQAVTAGQTASFSVAASGATPLSYQWRRDGAPVSGATGASYGFAASAADDGARFAVVVSNAAGAVTSAAALLTVRTSTSSCTRLGPTGDFTRTTTDGAGNPRTYELIVPTSYPSGAPLAVTFAFHGAGGNPSGARSFGLQGVPAAAAASIFVFPQGIDYLNYGIGWNDTCGGYDMVLFDHMLAEVEAAYCIDPARVYVAGFSWGCDFVTALACCRGDRIHAVAAASCSDEYRDQGDYTTYANLPCPVQNGARIRFTHSALSDGGYTAQQFATTSSLFRFYNGCSATASPVSPSPCVGYAGCRQPVVECTYPGSEHWIPSGFAADSWTFFTE